MRRIAKAAGLTIANGALAVALAAALATPIRAETITLASTAPNSGINKVFVDTFLAELEARAPEMDVEVFLDSQLGGERELIDLVRIGETTIHMGVIHSAQYYPELDATLVPYLFQSWEAVRTFLDGSVGERMEQALIEEGNARTLGYYYQGARWTTTQGRPFSTLDELKGIKIRMPEIPLWIDIWSGLGATITPMPSKEVFSAMQAGVIDAQENMLSNIYGRRLHEVSDYLIATRHQQSYVTVMINEDFWSGLEPAEQEAIQAAADLATEAADEAAREENERIVSEIVASGVELVEPDESFREGALPVVEKAAKGILAEGVWQEAVEAATAGTN